MSDITETIAEAREQAKARDCTVIEGGENVLLLDFDNAAQVEVYNKMKPKLDELFNVKEEQWWVSKSGGEHRHARIYLGVKLPADQRVALQAALGSDGFREMFAVRRRVLGVEEPSLLFRPNDAAIYGSSKVLDAKLKPATVPADDDDLPF